MKTVTLTDEQAATVKAILQTHAEMQDMRVNPSMELIARLKRDEPGETEMLEHLGSQVDDFETDRDDLQRLAELF